MVLTPKGRLQRPQQRRGLKPRVLTAAKGAELAKRSWREGLGCAAGSVEHMLEGDIQKADR